MGNLVFQATLGGQVNLVGPNTASTYNINVPTVNGNMVTTGDTGTVTNTMCATSVYTAPGTIGSGTPNTGAFTTLAASSTVTLSGGTANGVAYLNGSKVVTSGSALTFDGAGIFTVTSAVAQMNLTPTTTTNNALYRATNAGGTAFIGLDSSAGSLGAAYGLSLYHTGNYPIVFSTNGSEQMRLTSTGLGIGTSSPAYKLDVRGNIVGGDGTIKTAITYTTQGAIGTLSNHSLQILTNSNIIGTFDTSGNFGLGVTPSAWLGFKALQVGSLASLASDTSNVLLANNEVFDGTGSSVYRTTNFATRYQQVSGQHRWFTAASGSAGANITFTQAMTLDASGYLAVGTTSTTGLGKGINVGSAAGTTRGILLKRSDTNADTGFWYSDDTNMYLGSNNGFLSLSTVNTERARIDSSGTFSLRSAPAGNALQFWAGGSEQARMGINASNGLDFAVGSTSARMTIDSSGNLLVGATSAGWNPTGGGAVQFRGFTSHAGISGAFQSNGFNIQWNGSAARLWVDATDLGTISVSSDYRIKKNVEPQADNGIERLMRLRPVTYQMDDYGDLFKADGIHREGFIAHEVQEVIPSGAEGHKDQQDRIQNLRVDAILSVAVKAIQEQQAIIQQLQADVAALKGN